MCVNLSMLGVVSTPPRYFSFKTLGLTDNMSFGSLLDEVT
jgi:hypothetical protein